MTLPTHEQEILDRLEAHGNPIGYEPWRRNDKGHAVMRAFIPLGDGRVKEGRMTITPKGLVYEQETYEVKDNPVLIGMRIGSQNCCLDCVTEEEARRSAFFILGPRSNDLTCDRCGRRLGDTRKPDGSS